VVDEVYWDFFFFHRLCFSLASIIPPLLYVELHFQASVKPGQTVETWEPSKNCAPLGNQGPWGRDVPTRVYVL